MKMKVIKWFIRHSLTKTTLAALAAAITLLAPIPGHAWTGWIHGGNWMPDDGNNNGGDYYPTGITSSDTPAQAAAVADQVALDEMSVGISFVRIAINEATIADTWPVAQAYINELNNDGIYVLLCDFGTNNSGKIDNFTAWQTMWETVDSVYSGNGMVYYEPLNEPHTYSTESSLASSVYVPFLGFIKKNQSQIILDGTGYADDVTAVGADSRFNNCLLGLHTYAFWHPTYLTESQWQSEVSAAVGGYASRTVVTEFGTISTYGWNYNVSSTTNVYDCFTRGVVREFASLGMGSMYFISHLANNGYRIFNTINGGVTSWSLVNQLQIGWGFYSNPAALANCDFNSAGLTDYAIFRPSNSTWYFKSGGGGSWGTTGDIAVPADYAGNGKMQMAVWRPSNFTWYLDGVSGGGVYGTTGDIPVPADYGGTGKAQIAVFRPSNGTWYINGVGLFQFGTNGDIPVPGYYTGSSGCDLAVYRPSNNKWYINGANTVQFGEPGDIPVPGDYNGTGTTQIAVFRPSTGQWLCYQGEAVTYGQSGDVPVPGDYMGNGTTQVATWRPSDNKWRVPNVGATQWGTTGDVPLCLPYAIRHYCLGYTQ
ncbi:MAG TPA: cellulase family glycosylhydrolase [Candidatus Acidoferrales bacterium]|nr:cellulase family glycosylhydrolase [Candidatus Acidoferrales bacterium]